jgi:lactoylglutathione lyase
MSRIVHLALKVDNLERTTDFYRQVFGFKEMNTAKVRDHTSRHLSDGTIDLALIQYDAGTESAESKAAGEGPCIHHFAVEVADLASAEKQIRALGCEVISDPGVVPVKFRAPGGTVCELVPEGRYKKPKAAKPADRKAAAKKRPAKKAAKKKKK